MDLFQFLEQQTNHLCPHVFSVGKNGGGWTREHDPNSPHFGRWVDPNPDCRRPAHTGEPVETHDISRPR